MDCASREKDGKGRCPVDAAHDATGAAAVHAFIAGSLAFFSAIIAIPLLTAAQNGQPTAEPPETLDFFLGLLPLDIIAAGVALLVFLKQSAQSGKTATLDDTKPPRPPVDRIGHCILAIIASLAGVGVTTALTVQLFNFLDLPIRPMPTQSIMQAAHSPAAWTLLAACVVGLAPAAEEFLFRRICPLAFQHAGLPTPWFLAALLFAAIHGSLVYLPGLLVLALILNHMVRRNGKLLDAILVHAGYNAFILLLLASG